VRLLHRCKGKPNQLRKEPRCVISPDTPGEPVHPDAFSAQYRFDGLHSETSIHLQ